jgi:S-adenosyl-L-methionine hydrolase (adenosine-forming)
MGVKRGREGMGIITLLTDFGQSDGYVGALKGIILSINPDATLIDITHDISPQQIPQGGFILSQAAPYFPKGTIHLAVVDPGVGSASRRPVVVETTRHLFVGPDNGIFGQVLAGERIRRVIHLTNREYHRSEVSPTFHGRDIFAPVAAHLSTGCEVDLLGERVDGIKRGTIVKPRRSGDVMTGAILHIDRFGNLITNVPSRHLTSGKVTITAGGAVITRFVKTYGDAHEGEIVALIGSSGLMEIAKRDGSAACELGLAIGAEIRVKGGTP